jgi:hypothetical protein
MADDQNETEDKTTEPEAPAGQPDEGDSEGKGSLANVLADLAKERKRRQAAEAKVTEFEDRDKSELDKLRERAERAEKALIGKTREAIAASKGIPGELAGAIQGETEAEMEASALLFAKFIGTAEQKREQQSPTQRPGRRGEPVKATTTETADDWLRAKFHGED